ncbi:Predicted endonuclease, GIY-YIG superfamily [Lachnobacterium bovis]|uniref:Predicted endonuclease, GIY-YIG superfamily n=1 Tax=Lachnobacterium bovis TaxID=140626 RepID=A0A1H9T0H0_9FIRM|nr:GIY-YIG nuclease family protein [Lachnobacterium bovis]SER90514.1 Predicted endonuclease, GIY-YIG superfamily [Lachnobacterium bovis]
MKKLAFNSVQKTEKEIRKKETKDKALSKESINAQSKITCQDTKCTNYTYIVKCSDGTYYTGWTNDLEKRIKAHNEGKGAKYTKTRRPVELVYYESFPTKQEAMSREWHIKQYSRNKKETLIKNLDSEAKN